MTIIRKDAFRNCKKLKYVHLPEGLSSIGEGAFAGCTSLEEIVIPESVKEIEGGLKLQDCSEEEIEARYGKTQEIFDVKICILTYATDYKTVVSFRFKKEDMSLTRVRLNTIAEANSNGTEVGNYR